MLGESNINQIILEQATAFLVTFVDSNKMNKIRFHILIFVLALFLIPTVYQGTHAVHKHLMVQHDHCHHTDNEENEPVELCDILMFHYAVMETGFVTKPGEVLYELLTILSNNYIEPTLSYQYSFKFLRGPPFC